MKSKNKKRIIALMLCMVMTLSGGVSALAEDANAENVNSEENVQEVQDDPVMLAEEETSEPEAAPEAEPAVTETPAAPPKESTVAPEEPTAPAAPEAEPEAAAPEEALEPYEATYENADVIIKVSANEGIVPEGAELSVTPIEKKEITSDMTAEEKTEAEKINKQHEETEQKLQEESEKKENTLEGFLAYDISFLVNGQEVEPNGDVDVEMNFKKAALPEGMDAEIAKEAEVSVMHLEENQDGTVKKVVDMGKQNKVKTMKTTDEKKVQKVAFNSDLFSVYTVTWNNTGGKTVILHFVDKNGVDISEKLGVKDTTIKLSNQGNLGDHGRFQGIGGKYDNTDYIYKEARLDDLSGRIITDISYNNGWHYYDGKWNSLYSNTPDRRDVYLVYDSYDVIDTVDTAGLIDISLYDYAISQTYNSLLFHGNNGAGAGANNRYNNYVGNWGNGNTAVQGIMDKYLYTADGKKVTDNENYSGYPKLNVGNNKIPATTLLGDNQRVASGLNHLFTKDSNGYYEYNSATNYAYYNRNDTSNKDFVVYDDAKDKGGDQKGDFMPLTPINGDSEFYYGMTVGFNFIQPEQGKVNGQNMIFDFSGDDDVWVYVDGRLVLDLGGIHGAVGGSINFATGAVTINNNVTTATPGMSGTIGKNTTLKQLFNLTGTTFDDYTEHRLEFVYLERGAGESNCHLKFNMPPIPKESLQVSKEITNTDKEKYANIEFSFKVYLQDDMNGTNSRPLPEGTEYQIWKDGENTGRTGKIEKDHTFKLKHGETALFTGIARNLYYYAEEIGVSSDEFDKVEIPNWNVTYEDDEGHIISGTTGEDGITDEKGYIARSEVKRVGGNSIIKFQNRCSAANKRELCITKAMKDGQKTTDKFYFKVMLENLNGDLEAYNGEYYMQDADKNYYMWENDKLENKGKTSVACGTTTNGIIPNVPAGYTVSITQILSGTSFNVEEVNADGSAFYDERYNTPNVKVEPETSGKAENGIASGEIELGKNVEVTVTNSYKETKVPIDLKKFGTTYENPIEGAKFKLYQGELDEIDSAVTVKWDANPMEGYEEISVDNGEFPELKLNSGYYKLVESEAPEGYQLLANPIYFKVDSTNKDHPISYINGLTGEVLAPADTLMWKINEENPDEIDILNEVVYALPDSGGSGIYWYMIGGMLLMLAAALILYKDRCKEVLRK